MIDSRWLVISGKAEGPLSRHDSWHDKVCAATSPRDALGLLLERIATRPMAGPARSKGAPDVAKIKQRFAVEVQGAAEDRRFDASFLTAARRLCACDMSDTDAFGAYLMALRVHAKHALDGMQLEPRVVLHVTCRERLDRADASLSSFTESARMSISHVKVVGGGFDSEYRWDATRRILTVPAPDAYEHLPLKVILSHQLLSLTPSVVTVLKVDDDHRLRDAAALDREFRRSASLSSPVIAGRLIKNQFVGDHNRVWHFGKCQDPQLNRAPYGLPGPRQWVDGSYGYFLNRRALQLLSFGLTYFMPYVGISLYEDIATSYLLQGLGGSLRHRTMSSILGTVDDY